MLGCQKARDRAGGGMRRPVSNAGNTGNTGNTGNAGLSQGQGQGGRRHAAGVMRWSEE